MSNGSSVRGAIVGAVLVLVLSMTGEALAKVSLTAQVEAGCRDIKAATTIAGVTVALDRHKAGLDAIRRLLLRADSQAQQKYNDAKAAYDKEERDRKALYDSFKPYQSPTGKQEAQRVRDQAKTTFDQIAAVRAEYETRRQALAQSTTIHPGKTGGVEDERRAIEDLGGRVMSEYPPAKRAYDAAQKIVDDWEVDRRHIAVQLDPADDRLKRAKDAMDDALADAEQAVTDRETLLEAVGSLETCANARRLELEPGSDATYFESDLRHIDFMLSEVERRAPGVAQTCGMLKQQIQDAASAATQAAAEADLMAQRAQAQTTGQAVAAATMLAAMQQAQADAASSAAAVTQARNRAATLRQNACRAGQLVTAAPDAASAPAHLVEAQRNGALAENEVVISAGELQRIRAAYGRAQAATVPATSTFDTGTAKIQLDALSRSIIPLSSVPTQLRRRTSSFAVTTSWLKTVRVYLDTFKNAESSSPRGRFVQVHHRRIEDLERRYATQAATPDCGPSVQALLGMLERTIAEATRRVDAARALVQPLLPPPAAAQALTQIEGLYTTARGVANGTAQDAAAALVCVDRATAAIIKVVKPPTPPVEAGIKCRYKRPDGSTIEVTIFDAKTCPTEIPAKFVDWKPADKPDVMKDFSGKWFGHDPKSTYWTISGGTNVFSIVGAWRSDPRPDTAKADWTAECKRTSDVNVAECTGQGKYWDMYKYANYTMTLKVSLGSDGKSLGYSWKYQTVQFFTTAGEPRRHNDSIAPGRTDSGSMRR